MQCKERNAWANSFLFQQRVKKKWVLTEIIQTVSALQGGHLIVSKRRVLQDWVFLCCCLEPWGEDVYVGLLSWLQSVSAVQHILPLFPLAGLKTNNSKLSFAFNVCETEASLMSQPLPCFKETNETRNLPWRTKMGTDRRLLVRKKAWADSDRLTHCKHLTHRTLQLVFPTKNKQVNKWCDDRLCSWTTTSPIYHAWWSHAPCKLKPDASNIQSTSLTNWHGFRCQSISHCLSLSRAPGSHETQSQVNLQCGPWRAAAAHPSWPAPYVLFFCFLHPITSRLPKKTSREQTRKLHVALSEAHFLQRSGLLVKTCPPPLPFLGAKKRDASVKKK